MQNLSKYQDNFFAAFPHFDGSNVVVYILPSFNHFNAQFHDAGTKVGVFLGIDGILTFDGPDANMGAALAHELFHVYQYQIFTSSGQNSGQPTLAEAMFLEGSAAYVSQHVVPGATAEDALGKNLARTSPKILAQLACSAAPRLDSKNDADATLFLDAGAAPPGLPPRGGYLLGYVVTQNLNRSQTLDRIAHLSREYIQAIMETEVRLMCTESNSRV